VNPPVLVLDDATSAIDAQVEQRIHSSLRQLLANRTTLVIAHRLATISLADRVVLVEDGHVIASGGHQELLEKDPRYAEVLARVFQEGEAEVGP
jgi:ATP-binding cassette subfamily B protein